MTGRAHAVELAAGPPDGGASQILRDGVRVIVGPEETSRIKGEDLFLGFIRQELGVDPEA